MALTSAPGGASRACTPLHELNGVPPLHIVASALSHHPYPFFLDSALEMPGLGRFSFAGCDPFLVLRCRGRVAETYQAGTVKRTDADPLDLLQETLASFPVPRDSLPIPFVGGAVGFIGYDVGRLIERLPEGPVDDTGLPDMCMAFYDAMLAFDHDQERTFAVSTGHPEPGGRRQAERAARRLGWVSGLAAQADGAETPTPSYSGHRGLRSNMTRRDYFDAVRRAREYIVAGDIYQVNLSQRFQAPWPFEPWSLYTRLRAANRAPFGAFMDFGDFALLSASPERFLRRKGDIVETRPIKGTRPRGSTDSEDRRLSEELLASPKDRAEHIMIVDLERSDLGRVCKIGTVSVDDLAALESFSTVHHLTSTVRGRLRPDKGLADLVRATFPGGSITGAPKIRSMEIIDELEPTRRGLYTGAIGYFSSTGDLDLNIAIRTIVLKDGVASFHVGGGIVYDSEPEAEYRETLDKGKGLAQALSAWWGPAVEGTGTPSDTMPSPFLKGPGPWS